MTTKVSKHPDPRKVFPLAKDRIEFALEIDGVAYYEFYDFNNVPCERGFHALVAYNELQQRCTREYLMAHTAAWDDQMTVVPGSKKGIDLSKLMVLNNQLKERLDLIVEPDIAYKLSATVLFDASENPYRVDQKYTVEKALRFKKSPAVDFFLSRPIGKLIPYMATLGGDLQDYLTVLQKVNLRHLENIFTMLSEKHMSTEWYKSLVSANPEALASAKLST